MRLKYLPLLIAVLAAFPLTADDDGNENTPVLETSGEFKGETSAVDQKELPLFSLHFVLMTDHEKAVAAATPERFAQLKIF